MDYPEVIFATDKIGSNGIHCLDYKNMDEDVKYIRVDIAEKLKSHNKDYAAALDALKEWLSGPIDAGLTLNDYFAWLKKRLNSGKLNSA